MDLGYQMIQTPPGKTKSKPRYWNEEEDVQLRAAIKQHGCDGYHTWKEVANHVPNRTYRECMQRWTKVLAPGLKKGKWSAEEDQLLIKLVTEQLQAIGEEAGKSNCNKRIVWNRVSEGFNGRSCKQCRERWINHLDPSVKKSEWTKEEDLLLIQLSKNLPNKWAKIARQIPGRTENMVKVRFNALNRQARKRKQNMMFISQINTGSSNPGKSGQPKAPKLGVQPMQNMALPRSQLPLQNMMQSTANPGQPQLGGQFYHNVNNINNINIYPNPALKTETGRNLSIHSEIFKTDGEDRKNSLYFMPNYEQRQQNAFLNLGIPYQYPQMNTYPYCNYLTPVGHASFPNYQFSNIAAAMQNNTEEKEGGGRDKAKLTPRLSDDITANLRRLSYPLSGFTPTVAKVEPDNNSNSEEPPRRLSSLLYRDLLATQEQQLPLNMANPSETAQVAATEDSEAVQDQDDSSTH